MNKKLPDFIHVGPGRSGTTYFYEVFKQHPDICLAREIKETNFFNSNYNKGIEWYLDFFKDYHSDKTWGEISNTYIYDKNALLRIKEQLPDIKIITVFRNPFERIISVYKFRKKIGLAERDFVSTLNKYPEILEQSNYVKLYNDLKSNFDTEKLFIGIFDDLKNSPKEFLHQVYVFLNIPDFFPEEVLGTKINQSVVLRNKLFAPYFKKLAVGLRKYELYKTLENLKNSVVIKKLIYKPDNSSEELIFPNDIIFRINDQIDQLSSLIKRDFNYWKR